MSIYSTNFIRMKNHNPLLFNIVTWVLCYSILIFIFSKGNSPIKIDFIYTLGFLVSVAIPSLINLYLLIPFFLKKEKYLYFFLLFALIIFLFAKLNTLFLESILDYFFPSYFFISYDTKIGVTSIFFIVLTTTTLLKLSEDWFYFNKQLNKRLLMKNNHIQMQLTSLRSQINPHFLFNSLNVIYALALDKKDETQNAIIQLSDILRYVIYDSSSKKNSLQDEITLLKNYINFNKLRTQNIKNVKLHISVEDNNFMLYPMLLLPLVENSFKHSITNNANNSFINIKLKQEKGDFEFYIENNKSTKEESIPNKYSGIGLKNIKDSLKLIYPEEHKFIITENEKIFKVSLSLTTSKPKPNEY